MKRIDPRPSAILIEISRQLRQPAHGRIQPKTDFIARLGATVHVSDSVGVALGRVMEYDHDEAG
jgi:hypothetical protein